MKRLLAGVDIGTSGTKALLIDESGCVVCSKTVVYQPFIARPGWSEMHAQDWWQATCEALRAIMAQVEPGSVCALGLSGQMHGMVAMDENNEPVRPAILWNDVRTQKQCEQITALAGGEEALLGLINNRMLPGYTAGKILWMKQNEPDNFNKTKMVLNPKDYIRYCLTGLCVTEVSDASGTGLFDVKNRRFCWELIDRLGFPRGIFPPCVESCEITGTITPEAAKKTGLPVNLPVIGGGGDAVIQTTGMGIVSQDVLGIVVGTSGVVAMGLEQFTKNNGELQIFCNNDPGSWHAMGITLCAGGSLEWFKQELSEGVCARAKLQNKNVYKVIDEAAASVAPGSDGLFFLPFLSGERCPYNDPNARGTWIGLSLKTTYGAAARAIMEGVAYSLKSVAELMVDLGGENAPKKIIASGGGASSPFWKQIIADVFDLHVYTVLGSAEGGAFGAALAAGVGIGLWENLRCATKILKEESVTFAKADNVQKYKKLYEVYKGLYKTIQPAFKKIADVSTL